MRLLSKWMIVLGLLVTPGLLIGCDANDGVNGGDLDEAVDEVGHEVDEVADEVGDAIDDADDVDGEVDVDVEP